MRERARTLVSIVPFVLSALSALSGCYVSPQSGSLMQRSADARQLYRESDFGLSHLERDGVTSLATRLRFGDETLGQALRQGLVDTLEARLDDGLMHPNLAASQINEAGLSQSYAEMLDAYDTTHILDRDALHGISQAVGVRYYALPILVNFRETTTSRFSVFGLRLGKTTSANARIQLQIWDGQSGRIVWEGFSDLTLAQETFREGPIVFGDTVRATWESLIDQIPQS
jgi:hypothetical protein